MTENKHQELIDKFLALKDKLDEFKRVRDDPHLGMQHELPALANVVELLGEFTILNVEIETRRSVSPNLDLLT